MYELCHEIHTSERKSFRACRRRWDWLFRGHYYPYETAKPLEFGIAYHKAMEVWYNPNTWEADREAIAALAILTFEDECEAQLKAFLKQAQVPYIESEVRADYKERVELGRGMLKYYFTNVSPVRDKGFKPVKVEIGFKVGIKHPDTGQQLYCRCDECFVKAARYYSNHPEVDPTEFTSEEDWLGLPVVYAGRIDMLAQDYHGNYWIYDWKTAAQIRADMDQHLDLDDQITSYLWALRELQVPTEGFVYVEQWKNYPQEPKQNKNRRLGCLYSVSKQQAVRYDTYLACVKENDKAAYEEGCYDEFLAWLENEGPTFDQRYQKHRTGIELDQAGINIGLEALDMIDPKLRVYPSPGRFGCSSCAFRTPCMGKNLGEDYQYALNTLYEKREHYYVRQQASTETKGGE
jgi:hypothetical protein